MSTRAAFKQFATLLGESLFAAPRETVTAVGAGIATVVGGACISIMSNATASLQKKSLSLKKESMRAEGIAHGNTTRDASCTERSEFY